MSEDRDRRSSLARKFQEDWERAQKAVVPLEEQLAAKYQSALASHGREAVSRFNGAITAAGSPIPIPGITPDEMIPPEGFKASIQARTVAIRNRIVNEVASILLGSILADKAAVIPVFSGILESLAEQQAQFAWEAQQEAISTVILDAYREGWTVPETSEQLQSVLKDYAPWQATRLARTDLISLANATSLASAQLLRPEDQPRYKVWLTAQDDRVREAHVKADRQAVPIDQPFTVEGVALMYPGDPTAPAELIMNCRCTQVYADTPNPVLRNSFNGGNEEGDELALAAGGWNAAKHPRHSAGDERGGEFAPKEGDSTASVTRQAEVSSEAKKGIDEGTSIPDSQRVYIAEGVLERSGLVGETWDPPATHRDDPGFLTSEQGLAEARATEMVREASGNSEVKVHFSSYVGPDGTATGEYSPAYNRIVVRRGATDLTLLHEAAHAALRTPEGPTGHGREFQEIAATMYGSYISPESEEVFRRLVNPGLTSAGWNAALHPRHEKGTDLGGQFAPKDGTSSAAAQEQAYDSAQGKQEMERTRVHAEIGEIPSDNEELRKGLLESDLTDAQRDAWERAYREGGGWWPRTTKDWSSAEGEKLREDMATSPVIAAAVDHTAGTMVALYPGNPEELFHPTGQNASDLHVTLAYLPEGLDGNVEALVSWLRLLAAGTPVLRGQVGGVGYFAPGDNGIPVVAIVDVPGVSELATAVGAEVEESGHTVASTHGFVPHITLTYIMEGEELETPNVVGIPLEFTALSLVTGPDRIDFPFHEAEAAAASGAKVATNGDTMNYSAQPDAPVAARVAALRPHLPEAHIAEVLADEDEMYEPGIYERVGATREEVIALYAAASQTSLVPVDIPPTTITFSPQFLIQVPQQAPAVVHVSVPEQAPQPAPVIEVNLPSQLAPEVTVNVPAALPPTVNVDVAPPEINIPETIVNVAAPKAPIVNVTVPENDRKVKFRRDNRGQIISAEIEED